MKTVLNFLKRYIQRPWYIAIYPFFYFSKRAVFPVRFFSEQELVDNLKRGRSLIRMGDGEINFFIGLGNPYQKYDRRIEKMLSEVVSKYGPNSPYMLGVSQPITLPNWELKQLGRFKVWQPFKIIFTLFFPKNVGYADTHQFYYDNYFENIVAPVFKDKQVILITRQETLDKQSNNPNLPWKDIETVASPAGDALTVYEQLKSNLIQTLKGRAKNNTVLFFAVGPTGKYLMYELSKEGWQCLDIGKRTEVMFTGESIEYLI